MLPVSGYAPTAAGISAGTRALLDQDPVAAGDNLNSLPIIAVASAQTGAFAGSFYDDFYERFYLLDSEVDFGVVARSTAVPVTLWNARLGNGVLSNLLEIDLESDGVTISGLPLPTLFGPLSTKTHTFNASAAGETQIKGTVQYLFTPSQSLDLPIRGLRGKLWPLPINWAGGYKQTLEFKTEIIPSRSGKEQRIALRTTPRRSVEFRCIAAAADRREVNRNLDLAHYIDFIVPDVPKGIELPTAVMAGGTDISVGSVPSWASNGAVLTLLNGGDSGLCRVQAVDAGLGVITLSEPLDTDWPLGTVLCPGIIGALADTTATSRATNDVIDLGLSLSERPGYLNYTSPAAASVTHNGREVLLEKPNWSSPVSVSHSWATEEVDYARGTVARFVPTAFGTRATRWEFSRSGKAEALSLIETFMRARGRRGEFYAPTWENDLPPKSAIVSGTSYLRVEGTEAALEYNGSTVFTRLLLVKSDGTYMIRRVSSWSTVTDGDGSDSLLTLSEPWPADIPLSDIIMVSFLTCNRFASDILTVDWLTDSVASIQFNIQTIEDLSAEV